LARADLEFSIDAFGCLIVILGPRLRDLHPSKLVASVPTFGDVDDIFVDSKCDRIYVSCGEGFVDVPAADATAYRDIARIATAIGARTSLFVPELDRLLLAVPAKSNVVALRTEPLLQCRKA
jgi:hypothetical protein